ncbi:amidohydrolase family protein [Microbacterium sp. 18062]|uniref:N-acyl-D-amino-acid deacylase family protein n=1 Tax=Microbacterium sp. 18062 TaxID=2681410 RepID=UPI00135A09A1|nr:amidohydrolase family protein [Microbacterium sp. 18062]
MTRVGTGYAAYEIVLRGGLAADGSGTEPRRADVGIAEGRVCAVGNLGGAVGAQEIDIRGRIVMPGFIDAHSHADALVDDPRVHEAYLRQGVTTVVVGQDGLGFAPVGDVGAAYTSRYFAAVDGRPRRGDHGQSVAEFLRSVDGAGPLNAAALVPAGSVRADIVGTSNRPATAAEVAEMASVIAEGMDDGAVGLSTGLEYVPGAFASAEETAALCAPVGAEGGVYVSHLRGYSRTRIPGALEEAAYIGSASGARVHVSHLHGAADVVESILAALDEDRGVIPTFDSYPYLRGSTILGMLVLPAALQAGGADHTLACLADPAVRRALRADIFPVNERISSIALSFLADPSYRWAEGLSLQEAAERHGSDLTDFVCDALLACDLAVGCVVDNGADRTEDDLRRLLRHPGHVAGSDAIFRGSAPHPRGWGTFSRLLRRHVRELGDWTWGEAAWHLSGHTAAVFGLGARGRVAEDAIADLVVLDPATVADTATYADPVSPSVGVTHVLVDGQLVIDEGERTSARPGRGIRHERTAR